MEIIRAAARFTGAIAITNATGGLCSYGKLLTVSEAIKSDLQRMLPAIKGVDGPRVGIYAEPGMQYVAATWATWMAGGIAVPLAVTHPTHELEYVLQDAQISAVLTPPSAHDKLKDISHASGAAVQVLHESLFQGSDSYISRHSSTAGSNHTSSIASIGSSRTDGSGALIVYTSGTTGRPKGALHTHGSLSAQVQCLTKAWQWQQSDVMLHALPLHHVHGIINGLYCAHYTGATVSFLPKFSPAAMWKQLMSSDITVVMAVPTMYNYLLAYYEHNMTSEEQQAARAAAAALRLTVSGSAAAPVPLLQRWKVLSGQQLLERYGMTETGMILSNPYEGERRPGFVGLPLPGVEVKVVQHASDANDCSDADSNGTNTPSNSTHSAAEQGELAVRGPMLFREYWGRPQATAEAFDEQGYFLTGDTVSCEGDPPYYKILGRTSVDIIKSGGYKISALDVESTILHHPSIAEAAVLGVPDENLGQVVAALIHPKPAGSCSGESGTSAGTDHLVKQLQELCKQELALYAVPRVWRVLDAPLPRNAMGKVNKKELLKKFFPEQNAASATQKLK